MIQAWNTNISTERYRAIHVIRDLCAKIFLRSVSSRRNSFKDHRPTSLRISQAVGIRDPAHDLCERNRPRRERNRNSSWENTIGRTLSGNRCKNSGNNLANLLAPLDVLPNTRQLTLKRLHREHIERLTFSLSHTFVNVALYRRIENCFSVAASFPNSPCIPSYCLSDTKKE